MKRPYKRRRSARVVSLARSAGLAVAIAASGCTAPNPEFTDQPTGVDAMLQPQGPDLGQTTDSSRFGFDARIEPPLTDAGAPLDDDAQAPDAIPPQSDAGLPDAQIADAAPPQCVVNADCDDGISCTVDSCAAGSCSHQLAPGWCQIGSQCAKAGATDPSNACKVCQPQTKPLGWTQLACLETVAGTGQAGYADGPALTKAKFNRPRGIFVDGAGRIFVADGDNHAIRMIEGGKVTTLIGGPKKAGLINGPATLARLNRPSDVALDNKGRLFIADSENDRIRVLQKTALGSLVTTFAGAGQGFANGPAKLALFSDPVALAITPAGDKIYVADRKNHVIRLIQGAAVTTAAGVPKPTGAYKAGPVEAARFDNPTGVSLTPSGEILVADTGNDVIRQVSNGYVTLVAGKVDKPGLKDGPLLGALFSQPRDLVVTNTAIYVVDQYNDALRQITNGAVTTAAGGDMGNTDGPALSAKMANPQYAAAGPDGRIYISDQLNHRIRVFTPAEYTP